MQHILLHLFHYHGHTNNLSLSLSRHHTFRASDIYFLLIPIKHICPRQRIPLKHIDLCFRKVTRTNLLLKQQIQLREAPALGLRQAEIRVHNGQETRACPEEARVITPVPRAGVEHVRRKHRRDDADDVVQVAAEDDGLDSEAARRELRDERIAYRAYGELVEHGPDDHHGARGHGAGFAMRLGYEAKEAHDEEHAAETAEAAEVQCASPETEFHEEPGAEDAGHVDAVLAHGEVVGRGGRESGLLEEVGRVAREGVAAEVLDGPCHADDFGAAQVGSLEAVPVRGTLCDLFFERGCVHHHGNSFVGVEVGLAVETGEAEERLLGVFETAFADQPPGRFGGEEDTDYERDRPHPLQGVRDTVGPFVVTGQHGADHADTDELAETPAEIDVCCH